MTTCKQKTDCTYDILVHCKFDCFHFRNGTFLSRFKPACMLTHINGKNVIFCLMISFRHVLWSKIEMG